MNVEVRPIRTAAETALAANFAAAKASLPGADRVAALREEAFRRFPYRMPLRGAGQPNPPRFWRQSMRAGSCLSMAASCRSFPTSPIWNLD